MLLLRHWIWFLEIWVLSISLIYLLATWIYLYRGMECAVDCPAGWYGVDSVCGKTELSVGCDFSRNGKWEILLTSATCVWHLIQSLELMGPELGLSISLLLQLLPQSRGKDKCCKHCAKIKTSKKTPTKQQTNKKTHRKSLNTKTKTNQTLVL